jgi:hypothetical protein
MKGLGDVFALGPRVEPRPKAVTQGKGLEHAFGKIGPACRCGSEICGDGLEGGLMMVIDRRMQWEEDSIFWLDRAYFLNGFNEGLVYGLHNCLRAETQGPESFGGFGAVSLRPFPPYLLARMYLRAELNPSPVFRVRFLREEGRARARCARTEPQPQPQVRPGPKKSPATRSQAPERPTVSSHLQLFHSLARSSPLSHTKERRV